MNSSVSILTKTTTWNMPAIKVNSTDIVCHVVKPESEFPDDFFSLEQRKNGAIIFHILISVYIIGIVAMIV
jgi:hypothetical protein